MSKEGNKLKVAAEEIKDILRKHDITGVVSLHTPGCGEYFVHLHASYSCAYVYDDSILRFYSKRDDYANADEHLEKVRSTSNMMRVLSDITGILYLKMDKLSKLLDGTIGAEHNNPIIKENKKEEDGSSI